MLATWITRRPTPSGVQLLLRVNFKSGLPRESFGVKFIGSDGTMTVSFTDLELQRVPRPDEFDYTTSSFSDSMQKRLREAWDDKHPQASVSTLTPDGSQKFSSDVTRN